MGDGVRVGERVATLRKLAGWTQQQLADEAFVSRSLVKKVEQGRIPASAAFVASCARAWGMNARDLYGTTPEDGISELHAEVAGIAELREALHSGDDPRPVGPPGNQEALAARLLLLERRRRAQHFAELALALPDFLHHVFALVAEAPGGTEPGTAARSLLHDAYRLVANVGGHYRQTDIAAIASERHVALAESTGDPLRVSLSEWHRSTYFLQHGLFAAGSRLLDRSLARITPDSPQARGMAAQLHLRAAVLAARGRDAGRADEHLGSARRLVDAGCAAEPFPNTDASRLNVDVHWCALPVEMDDGTEAVRRAAAATISDRARPERVAHHHIDQARAWFLHGDRQRSLAELNRARKISPQQTRVHPSVRETVHAIADSDRRTTGALADFARWSGIAL